MERLPLCSKNITFKLVKYSAALENGGARWIDYKASSTTSKTNYTQTGAYTATFTATKKAKFVSYKVNDIGTIYAPAADDEDYQPSVTVKGVLNNGQTVDLNVTADYKLEVDDASKALSATGGTLKGVVDAFTGTETSKDCSYRVIINHDGKIINKTVKVSKDAPTVNSIKFISSSATGINVPAILADASATEGIIRLNDLTTPLKGVDSYGIDATIAGSVITTAANSENTHEAKFTISDIDSVNGTVSNNGTATTTLAKFAKGDSFTLTVTCENATFSTIVSVKDARTLSSENKITGIEGIEGSIGIDHSTHKITGIPAATTVGQLKAALSVSDGATFKIVDGEGNAVGDAVVVTATHKIDVTAEDGTEQNYDIAIAE